MINSNSDKEFNDLLDEKTNELKNIVGDSLTIKECESFVKGTITGVKSIYYTINSNRKCSCPTFGRDTWEDGEGEYKVVYCEHCDLEV